MSDVDQHQEIERRWIVRLAPGWLNHISTQDVHELDQAYLDDRGLRVRLYRDLRKESADVAELTQKQGKGLKRVETNVKIDPAAAAMLLDSTHRRVRKTRHSFDGWELDEFADALKGIYILERELASIGEPIPPFPSFIIDPIEVTETLNNAQLASMAAAVSGDDRLRIEDCVDVPLHVLTGGPCGGKSTTLGLIKQDGLYHCVPEIATIMIGQIGLTAANGETLFQRTLYRVQRTLEDAAMQHARRLGLKAVIMDRGTLDSAAFIRGGVHALENMIGIDAATEMRRYASVTMLDVVDEQTYALNRHNNPVRSESWSSAMAVQERLHAVWSTHPEFRRVSGDLGQKVAMIRDRMAVFSKL